MMTWPFSPRMHAGGSSSDIDHPAAASKCTLCGRIQTYLRALAGPAIQACVDDRQVGAGY
jgi:hypothetical protein